MPHCLSNSSQNLTPMLITFYANLENTSKLIEITEKSRKLIYYSFVLDDIGLDGMECKLTEFFSIVSLTVL